MISETLKATVEKVNAGLDEEIQPLWHQWIVQQNLASDEARKLARNAFFCGYIQHWLKQSSQEIVSQSRLEAAELERDHANELLQEERLRHDATCKRLRKFLDIMELRLASAGIIRRTTEHS